MKAFCWEKNNKYLECSEMQEYAKQKSGIFVCVSAKNLSFFEGSPYVER